MKKFFTLAAIVLFMMTSCSSDDQTNNIDNTDNNNPGDGTLLVKTIDVFDGETVTANYSYDNNRLKLIDATDGSKTSYFYENDNLSKIEITYGTKLVLRWTFTYNNANRLTEFIRYSYEDMQGNKKTFSYNDNGTVSYNSYFGNHNTQETLNETALITLTNGNISRYERIIDGQTEPYSVINYHYDNNSDPLKDKISNEVMAIAFKDGVVNNLVKQTGPTGSEYLTVTYTYNDNGLPATSVEKESIYTRRTQYFYQ